MEITIRRLESGYWYIRGDSRYNWAQPPEWPCDRETLEKHASPSASEDFLLRVMEEAKKDQP